MLFRSQPVLKEFCLDCHNAKKHKGDLDLEPLLADPKFPENRDAWEKAADLIMTREMPPEKKPQPTDEQRELLLKFIDGQLSKADCKVDKNPGKVTIRRLNKEEYRNTIHDLLGVNYEPVDFPNDEVGYGFDNIGDVLSLPPMLMEKLIGAAGEIVRKAVVLDAVAKPFVKRIKGNAFESANDASVNALDTGVLGFYREGEGTASFDAPLKSEYTFRVRAYGDLAGPEAPKLALRVNGMEVQVFRVTNSAPSEIYEVKAALEAGAQKISVSYLNNYNDQNNPDPKLRGDRNVFVRDLEITGPALPPPTLPESHRRLITRLPERGQEHACAVEILGAFAPRAYRRPVEPAEVERLAG